MDSVEESDIKPSPSGNIEAKSNRKIMLGAIAGYVYLVLQIVSGFLFVPLISAHYGQDQYGLFTLTNSLVSLFLLDTGLSGVASRYLAQYKAQGREKEMRSLLGFVYKIYIGLSAIVLVIFVVAFFCLDYIYPDLSETYREKLNVMFIIAAASSTLSFGMQGFNGVLNAFEEYPFEKGLNILQRCLYIVLCSCALAFDWDIVSITAIASGTGLFCYLLKYLYIRFKNGFSADFRSPLSKEEQRQLLIFSGWNLVASICYQISTYIAPTIVAQTTQSDLIEVSVYSVGAEIENYALIIASVLNGLFVPKIARIMATSTGEERKIKLTNLAKEVGLIASSIFSIIIIGFLCLGQKFISVWMNDEGYANSYYVALILMIGQSTTLPMVVFTNALYFEDNVKFVALARVASLVAFVAAAYILGNFYGAIGVAIGVAIGMVVRAVVLVLSSYFRLGIRIGEFMRFTYLRQVLAWIVLIGLGISISWFVPLSDLFVVIIGALAISAAAALIYWFLVFPKSLRDTLLTALKLKRRQKRTLPETEGQG